MVTSSGSSAQLAETARIAKILLGWCDPREANDPEIFTASIIAVLSAYPLDVQRIVADPRSALLARYRQIWPFPERVRVACESIEGPRLRRLEWDKRSADQLAEREREKTERPTIDTLKAKYGEHYGMAPPSPEPTMDEAAHARRMISYSQHCIERDYAAHGKEPVVSGGVVISRSLIESVTEQNRKRAQIPRTTD